ncbi:MAG: GxxExxY protein [Chloroflexi bacterium]|nr:GxxExxY protein [Chloroflexota bacterium]
MPQRSAGEVELIFKDEVYAIIGAAIEVHKELGHGFLEAVYQEALEMELGFREIPFEPQKPLRVFYKGRPLKKEYACDFQCYTSIIVEIKAIEKLSSKDESQLLNYLSATKQPLGLLINFGSVSRLEWKRLVN